MNPSFSTLLPKCQMFQHTYTRFFWNQELNISGIRKNSWLARSYAPLCMIRYHIHHADCTGLRLSETNESLQEGCIFCIFFPRGNGHLFNCLSSTVSVAHYTRAPNTVDHTHTHACWHERMHADLCHASYSACVLNRTLLHAAPGQRLLCWNKSIMCTAEHEKQLWLAFHVGAYSFIQSTDLWTPLW